MHQQIRIFVNGFVIILAIMIVLALIAFQINNSADSSANKAVTHQLQKINLTQELSTTISKRTQLTQLMLLRDNPLIQDDDRRVFEQLDQSYKTIQQQLLPLLNAREREYLNDINKLNDEITELNQQVSVLFINGSQREATKVLLEDVLPKTEPQLARLSELVTIQRDNASEVLQLATQTADDNRMRFFLYAVFSVIASLIVAALAVYYGQKLTHQLEEMTDYLEEKVSERTESLLDTQKELIEDNNELARLASTDTLTGLFNRNYMGEILNKEHSRYQRHNHRFGIILIDIDYFKKVNDTHGHDVGDRVLAQMAHYLASAVRNSDYIGRWGGEEFLICCTTIETGDIQPVADNIRNFIANAEFDVIDRLTISLGCAIIQPGESIESLIKRADVALYQAKNNGRNKTMVSAVGT